MRDIDGRLAFKIVHEVKSGSSTTTVDMDLRERTHYQAMEQYCNACSDAELQRVHKMAYEVSQAAMALWNYTMKAMAAREMKPEMRDEFKDQPDLR
jgi:hypothetical protein